MELRINNFYHVRIKKDAPVEFTLDELEKILRAEDGLTVKFVLKDAELISFSHDDHKVRTLKKELDATCDFKLLTVTY